MYDMYNKQFTSFQRLKLGHSILYLYQYGHITLHGSLFHIN